MYYSAVCSRVSLAPTCIDRRTPCHHPQITALTNLESLRLSGFDESNSFKHLTRMTALTELCLARAVGIPACLTALTQLRALVLRATPFTDAEYDEDMMHLAGWATDELAPALARLTRLTRLCVADAPVSRAFPASLAGLRQLRRCVWASFGPDDPLLPAGPWLSGLQRLTLPQCTAEASVDVWKQARNLKLLVSVDLLPIIIMAPFPLPKRPADGSRRLPRLRNLKLHCIDVDNAAARLVGHVATEMAGCSCLSVVALRTFLDSLSGLSNPEYDPEIDCGDSDSNND